MGVSRREPLYQTTARPHELYCNEVSSRIIADLRDERDQLNEAILARMPFHVLSVQFLTNGGVTPSRAPGSHLETFLLELEGDSAFVGRQRRLRIGDQ